MRYLDYFFTSTRFRTRTVWKVTFFSVKSWVKRQDWKVQSRARNFHTHNFPWYELFSRFVEKCKLYPDARTFQSYFFNCSRSSLSAVFRELILQSLKQFHFLRIVIFIEKQIPYNISITNWSFQNLLSLGKDRSWPKITMPYGEEYRIFWNCLRLLSNLWSL